MSNEKKAVSAMVHMTLVAGFYLGAWHLGNGDTWSIDLVPYVGIAALSTLVGGLIAWNRKHED